MEKSHQNTPPDLWDIYTCQITVQEGDKTPLDLFIIGDRRSADETSPIEYVHNLLNQRLRVLLINEARQIVGVFVGLDSTGTLTLKDCVDRGENHEREFPWVCIPLVQIQSMELAV
jgi:small nuclear ribonucleoprotein (snRNP)-like protein